MALNAKAGVDTGDMPVEDVGALFGKTEGFVATQTARNPETTTIDVEEEEDF